MTTINHVRLKVEGMTCQGCVTSVTRIVARIDPSAQVSVDLATGDVTAVTVATPPQLIEAIQSGGFTAHPA